MATEAPKWKQTIFNHEQEQGGLCYIACGEPDKACMAECYAGQAKAILGPHEIEVPIYHGRPGILDALAENKDSAPILMVSLPDGCTFVPGVASLVAHVSEHGHVSIV